MDNQQGLELRAVIEVAPKEKLLAIAQQFDDLRKQGVSYWGSTYCRGVMRY